jgi:hypothetical protein
MGGFRAGLAAPARRPVPAALTDWLKLGLPAVIGVRPPTLKDVSRVGVLGTPEGREEVVDPPEDRFTAFSMGKKMPEPGTVVRK